MWKVGLPAITLGYFWPLLGRTFHFFFCPFWPFVSRGFLVPMVGSVPFLDLFGLFFWQFWPFGSWISLGLPLALVGLALVSPRGFLSMAGSFYLWWVPVYGHFCVV